MWTRVCPLDRLNNPSCGLLSGLVEGVNKNEEGQLEDESGGGNGVNVLGEAGGELAEGRFNAFAKVLNQSIESKSVAPANAAACCGPGGR